MRRKVYIVVTKQMTGTPNNNLIKNRHSLHSKAEELRKTKQSIRKIMNPLRQRRPLVAVG